MSKTRILASTLCVAAVFTAPAFAANLSIQVDEVRVITFASPVKTVFVGNPTIADVNVIDSRHVFLQGKTFGTTNILALDNSGKQISEDRITVLNHQDQVVTLQRGPARTTLNCAANRCEVSPTPGDESAPFEAVTGQIDKRQEQNMKAAAANQ